MLEPKRGIPGPARFTEVRAGGLDSAAADWCAAPTQVQDGQLQDSQG